MQGSERVRASQSDSERFDHDKGRRSSAWGGMLGGKGIRGKVGEERSRQAFAARRAETPRGRRGESWTGYLA